MPDERASTPRPGDGARFQHSRPPFRPGPRPDYSSGPVHTLRIRDGEREVEVSGSAIFVRQMLDDLPGLLARLRGEGSSRPAAIRMPAPPNAEPAPASPRLEAAAVPHHNGASLEKRVLDVLRHAERPLAVAAIRKRLGSDVTPQQVRRVLERAGSQVSASGDRPASYRIARR